MREIKFRSWIDSTLGDYMAVQGEPDLETLGSFMHHYSDCKNLMQYTGLKDKNEKEIYEGDIVSVEYGKGIVEYSEKQTMFIINWIEDNESYNESLAYNPRNYIYGKTRKDIKIIGNIYENPELLQSSE